MPTQRSDLFKALVAIAAIVAIFAPVFSYALPTDRPAGIILFIGDGMGINQVRSAALYSEKVLGKPLAMDSFPTRGITTTHSTSSDVTDSAAAATALSSGHKTYNRAINVLPDGRILFTIGQAAKEAGLSVGVLTTSRLTDATPAGIYAHTKDRNEEDLIAEQFVQSGVDVALAGGLRFFIPKGREGSKRRDDKDLVEAMKHAGYTYVTNASELEAVDPAKTPKLFGLFAISQMAYAIDHKRAPELSTQPDLAEMTRVALSILGRNSRGFFAMIEGGRIDHACHSHDIKTSILDTLALDKAVKVGLEYQKAHPDTLILVTADHETGGLGLGRGTEYAMDVAAVKPFNSSFELLYKKIQKNPGDLENILKEAGFDLTPAELALLKKHPPETKIEDISELGDRTKAPIKYAPTWGVYALGLIESERAKVGWTSFAHTAQPVITYAVGPGAAEFAGAYDNTDIAKKMAKLLGLTLPPPADGTPKQ
jgi:alkaline phosphatase